MLNVIRVNINIEQKLEEAKKIATKNFTTDVEKK